MAIIEPKFHEMPGREKSITIKHTKTGNEYTFISRKECMLEIGCSRPTLLKVIRGESIKGFDWIIVKA